MQVNFVQWHATDGHSAAIDQFYTYVLMLVFLTCLCMCVLFQFSFEHYLFSNYLTS